jgi:hypothetical protein
MDARAKTVREILHSGDQYLIPFFQRYYSWKRRHWERLRADVWALADDEDVKSQHFLGPLVCTPTDHVPGEVPAYQLIDGQQRLATLTLMLSALRDVALEHGLGDLAEEVTEDYLIHKRKKGLQRYKVVPRIGDREALIAVIEGKIEKEHQKFGVFRAWRFFHAQTAVWAADDPEARLRKLFVAVTGRLSLVVVTIDGENPYEIFESLNSTGLPLEEADLIRNYIFMQVPTSEQEAFNAEHWEAFEELFEEAGEYPAISQTQFYRSYLMRQGVYSKARVTFLDYKEEHRRRSLSPADQVTELKQFARYEQVFRRPATCKDESLRAAFQQIEMLEITTAHPLLMNLMDRQESGKLDKTELLGCLDDLASFVMRRSICGESTRAYGRWFVEAIAAMKDAPREDLREYYLRRRWPDDAAFIPRLQEFALYRREPKKCRLILEALERSYGHKEKVDPNILSIEHIMPQTIEVGKSAEAWQAMLGDGWQSLHEKRLHTIGNLTLTGYNPDLGNKSFPEKRAELARSNLVLNRYFEDVDTWDEQAIEARGEKLAAEVARLWPRPEGGEYIPPADIPKGKLTVAERRQRRVDYWTGLLSVVQERGVPPKFPKPSRRGWLGFSLGVKRFRLLAFIQPNKRNVGVALACRGPNGKKNFALLKEQSAAIEAEVGAKLLWEELPQQKSSHVTLRLSGVSPADRQSWSEQHAWLAEKLETLYDVFSKHCQAIVPEGAESETRHVLRKKFWTGLLERASQKTNLHAGISPGVYHWIGTGAGMGGLGYNYVVTKHASSVELYIDRGKGSKAENKHIFDRFKRGQTEIEAVFAGPLEWERLDAKRACRIVRRFEDGGYRDPEQEWPEIQDTMIDAMIRLEKALAPHVAALKEKG